MVRFSGAVPAFCLTGHIVSSINTSLCIQVSFPLKSHTVPYRYYLKTLSIYDLTALRVGSLRQLYQFSAWDLKD